MTDISSWFSDWKLLTGQSQVVSDVRSTATAAPDSDSAGVLDLGDMVINEPIRAAVGSTIPLLRLMTRMRPGQLKKDSAIAIAAAINKSSAETGVFATANANVIVGQSTYTAAALDGDTIRVNGVDISTAFDALTDATHTRLDVADAFNTFSGQTGVVVTDNGVGLTFTAADGRNITLESDGDATDFGLRLQTCSWCTHYSTITLSSSLHSPLKPEQTGMPT